MSNVFNVQNAVKQLIWTQVYAGTITCTQGTLTLDNQKPVTCNNNTPPFQVTVGEHIGYDGPANGAMLNNLALGPNAITLSADAQIANITAQLDLIFDSPDWPGTPGQQNVELLSGGLESVDDTLAFTSIFVDGKVGTGCTPEPGTLLLLASGLACIETLRSKVAGRSQSSR